MYQETRLHSIKILAIVVTCTLNLFGQGTEDKFIVPRTNSKAVVQQTLAATQIEITYSRPNKKGRTIFGELVPYGQLWRTGADEATQIYFSTEVMLSDIVVDSGRYELFTIPGKDEWEVILQNSLGQWGTYHYDASNDVARFKVAPELTHEVIETFAIEMVEVGADTAILNLTWDKVVVPIPIRVDLKRTVIPRLEASLIDSPRPPYFQAAMFYYENEIDINRAAELMKSALEQNPDHLGMLYRYALILREKGDFEGALHAAERSLELAYKASPELMAEYVRLNNLLLNNLKVLRK